jgi:hypothetical protein
VPHKIRPLQPEDHDKVIEMSLRAWAPVFASFENVLGQEILLMPLSGLAREPGRCR